MTQQQFMRAYMGVQGVQQKFKKVIITLEDIKRKIKAGNKELDTILHQAFFTLQQLL